MSDVDKRKEQKEYQCLIDVYNYCVNNDVPQQTRDIIKHINGEHVVRDKNDNPDIINICTINDEEKIIVGIEHFNVSSISRITQSGKNISLYKLHVDKLSKIRNEMIREKDEDGSISNEMINKNNNEVGALAEDALNGTYESYIHSFQTSWDKHVSRIDNYYEQTKELAEKMKVNKFELAFLIDIDTEFLDMFYNYSDGKVIYDNTGLVPVFKEIVSIIKQTANAKKVEYIIFYNKNVNKSNQSVIAFRTEKIESDLQNQNFEIYEYLGENSCKVKIDSIEQDGGNITPNYRFIGYEDEYIKNSLFPLYRKAKSLKEKHIPFVASRSVQHLLFVDPDSCSDKNEQLRRSSQFTAKYSKNIKEE